MPKILIIHKQKILFMEDMNLLPVAVAALIPSILGFIYYHPKVAGTAWMKEMGKTEKELMEGFNMPVVMIVSLILSFFLAFFINATMEMVHKDVNDAGQLIYGSHHTFGHGMFHGAFFGILSILSLEI